MPIEHEVRALGIIPARGGSKGVPRKNIRIVAGRPLIAYSILAAQGSRMLSAFVTSTEDDEISEVATEWGSRVVRRPVELSGDDTPMLPVVENVLKTLQTEGEQFDYVVLLQPTAPLRNSDDIDQALQILIETHADTVISVYQISDHHPARMYTLEAGQLIPYEAEPENRLRQDLIPVYHRNGAIYAFGRKLIEDQGTLIGKDTRPYIMPRERSVNIDDEIDLLLADLLLQQYGND